MKKKVIIGICVLIVLILLFPVRLQKALLYKVSDVHSLTTLEEYENGKEFNEGIIIEILGIEVFNNVE